MSLDLVLIGSWDRSGSTVVGEVLGAAPDVVSVGELSNLWERGIRRNRMCACGQAFSACPFWTAVMGIAFQGAGGRRLLERVMAAASALSNHRLLLHRLSGRSDSDRDVYAEGLGHLFRAVQEVSARSVVVDSSKIPWHVDAAMSIADAAPWLLHMIRDPRGVVYSHQKVLPYDGDETDPDMMARQGAAFATLGWGYRNLMISGLWAHGPNYMRLNYEDFVTNPAVVAAAILRPLRVEPPTFASSHSIDLPRGHSVSGNPVRFAAGLTVIRPDDEWRDSLRLAPRVAVGAVTWPLRRAYRTSTSRERASRAVGLA